MRSLFPLILFFLIACGKKAGPESEHLSAKSDPKALEFANQTMQAMGGLEVWNGVRYLRFDFVVEKDGKEISRHAHLWDKFAGRYRVQGKMRDGSSYCVLFEDVNRKTGKAYIGGRLMESKEAEEKLQYGYNRFINDTYWLLMPWKMKDPGVRLRYEGPQMDSLTGKSFEIIHLDFDKVGLTPKDQYWAYINSETFLMERWKFLLQDGEQGTYEWKNWGNYGNLKFSVLKNAADGSRSIRTENIKIYDTLNDDLFTKTETFLP